MKGPNGFCGGEVPTGLSKGSNSGFGDVTPFKETFSEAPVAASQEVGREETIGIVDNMKANK